MQIDMNYKGSQNYKFITDFKSHKNTINNVYIYKTERKWIIFQVYKPEQYVRYGPAFY